MSRRILLTLAMVALIAMPAHAAVQSVKVSGSIDSTWLVRDQFDLGNETVGISSEFYQNLLITQAILRIDADLTDNVSAVIELINEREWGDESNTAEAESDDDETNSTVDVNLAYITLREMLYSPLTVVVGRQPLRYGNGLIIGDPDTNNASTGRLRVVADDLSKRKSFDAVKAIFDYDPLTIDIFAAKVDANQVTGASGETTTSEDDIDLYGIVGNWKLQDERNTEVEAYFFAEINADAEENKTGSKASTIYVPGLRVASNPIENLYTSAEIAWQSGNYNGVAASSGDNQPRSAMAIQTIGTYAIPIEAIEQYSPIISGSYTWVTGDSNPTDTQYANQASENKWTAWDPMYEDQAGGKIYNSIMDLTNCHIYITSIQATPLEDITAKLSWTGLYLDKEFDESAGTNTWSRTLPDSTTAFNYNVAVNENHLGNELDLDLMYDYTEDVQIGFSAGWFFPGDVFTDENHDTAKQFLTNVNVRF